MRNALVVIFLANSAVAHADLDADRKRKDAADSLAEQLKRTNDHCGTKLTASFDYASEKNKPADPPGAGANICFAVVKGISDVCDKDDGKQGVKSKLKVVKCAYDGKVTSKKSGKHAVATDLSGNPHAVPHAYIQLDKTTLKYSFDWFTANSEQETAEFLTKQL